MSKPIPYGWPMAAGAALIVAMAGCGQGGATARPAPPPTQSGRPATGNPPAAGGQSPAPPPTRSPAADPAGQPPPGWQLHTSSAARFAVGYPPGWAVTESAGPGGWLQVSLTPPGGRGGVLIRRQFTGLPAQQDLPNTRCIRIRISQLPGLRCTDTISGSLIATLQGTSQGNFQIMTSRRESGYTDFDTIVASFQLLRGA